MNGPLIEDLFQAIQSGTQLNSLLESDPSLANTENKDGLTPLGFAAHFGNKEAAQVLLDYGADINAVSHSKISFIPSNTALHAAIAGERNIDLINLFMKHHADTNLLDSNGHTCLHTAAFHDDNIEIICLLLEHGANIKTEDQEGDTALSLAVKQGNHNVAEFLRSRL